MRYSVTLLCVLETVFGLCMIESLQFLVAELVVIRNLSFSVDFHAFSFDRIPIIADPPGTPVDCRVQQSSEYLGDGNSLS